MVRPETFGPYYVRKGGCEDNIKMGLRLEPNDEVVSYITEMCDATRSVRGKKAEQATSLFTLSADVGFAFAAVA